MTYIETDNPLLQWRIWCYDITWQYWYIWLLVLVVAVWFIARHFAKRQREWDEKMLNERKKHDDFKRKVSDLYKGDTIEMDLKDIKPHKGSYPV